MRTQDTKLGNKRGMALVVVILVFLVATILTSSVVAMVYSDTMFSHDDENEKKAHYVARAAITSVEKAIWNQFYSEDDSDGFDSLEELKAILVEAEEDYESAPAESNSDELAAWNAAKKAYEDKYDYIMGTGDGGQMYILPHDPNLADGSPVELQHIVTFDDSLDADNEELSVFVKHIGDEEYEISCTATVNDRSKTLKKLIGVYDNSSEVSSVELNSVLNIFEDALYAMESISAGNNNYVYMGDVSYGSGSPPAINTDGRGPGEGGEIHERATTETPPTPTALFKEYTGYTYATMSPIKTFNPSSITSGRFTATTLNTNNLNINVNTSSGNVVWAFPSFTANKSFTINATGYNSLIIYCDGDFLLKNDASFLGTTLVGADGKIEKKTDIYIFLNGANVEAKNKLAGKNVYIFCPNADYSSWNLLGDTGFIGDDEEYTDGTSSVFTGSIYGKNITLKNNSEIAFYPPKLNYVYGVDIGGGGTLTQTIYAQNMTGHWLK